MSQCSHHLEALRLIQALKNEAMGPKMIRQEYLRSTNPMDNNFTARLWSKYTLFQPPRTCGWAAPRSGHVKRSYSDVGVMWRGGRSPRFRHGHGVALSRQCLYQTLIDVE